MTPGRPATEHMTYDLSSGGIRLCGLPSAEVGGAVTVRLQLKRAWIRASGRLLRAGGSDEGPDFAVEFVDLPARAEDSIHDVVVEALARPERRSVLLLQRAGERCPPGGRWLSPIWSICATASTPLEALWCLERHAIELGVLSCSDLQARGWTEAAPGVPWRTVGPLGCLHRLGGSR